MAQAEGVGAAGWFYSNGGQQHSGPVPEQALKDLFATGAIQPSTLVWHLGMAQWATLGQAVAWAKAPPPVQAAAVSAKAADTAWSDQPHPWRRWFSRWADYLVVGLPLITLLLLPLYAMLGVDSRLTKVIGSPIACGIILVTLFPLAEAFLLSTWGFTPTRALMGIYIRNQDGSKLSFLRALQRSWYVAMRGEGFGVPLVSLITVIGAYYDLKNDHVTWWDHKLDISVRHRRWGVLRGMVVVVWCVLAVLVVATLNAMELASTH
jgi:hypothetical protein